MTFINDKLGNHQENTAFATSAPLSTHSISRFNFDLQNVIQCLRRQLLGQEQAIDAIIDILAVVKADFSAKNRPLAVMLMVGPTGVGKTETVRIISQAIYGDSDAFCRIDMNTLTQEHYAAALTGAPPGYVGSKEGHTLFHPERIAGSFSKPGIVLFDEIEKASDEVIRTLLNVLDSGYLRLTAGTKAIDFTNCLIFMTSNLGAKAAFQRGKVLAKLPAFVNRLVHYFHLDERTVVNQALQRKFDLEFLNRIDRILVYNRISAATFSQAIELELAKLNQRLAVKGVSVTLTSRAKQALNRSYDIKYGIRGLSRMVRTEIEPLIAHWFLNESREDVLSIDYRQQRFVIAAQH